MIQLFEKILLKGLIVYIGAVGVVRSDLEKNGEPSLLMIFLLCISSFIFAYGMYAIRRDILNYIRKK